MSLDQLTTIDAIRQFLDGTQAVAFSVATTKQERYRWVQKTLVKHRYLSLSRADKGVVIRYLMKVTGYSLAQTKRLIRQYAKSGKVTVRAARNNGFTRTYTDADIRLLVGMDECHGQPSGAVLKKLCERAYQQFGLAQYQRLSHISVSHLYNLRASTQQPGYIRIDSVHQGDQGRRKGVYHINAVDEVTQFQVMVTLQGITEEHMIPALKQLLGTFPFKIKGFHADNGGEYINYSVAGLLETLRIELTKSRPRRSNDNGLVESKNGSVVRKLYGYTHIPQQYADEFAQFNNNEVYRYINFHRPCYFPSITIDSKGKQRKQYHYKDMMTPYEKFKSLQRPSQYLKAGITLKKLDAFAQRMNDNEAAEQLNSARHQLFKQLHERQRMKA